MKILKKIGHWYNVFEECFVAVMLFAATMICCYEVFMRYVLVKPTKWSEEYIRYMMVWMVFLGISVASKNPRDLINFDLVYSKMGKKAQICMDIVIYLLILAFCILCLKISIAWEAKTYAYGGLSTAMRIPNWIPRIIMPVSFGLLCIRYCIHLIEKIYALATFKKNGVASDAG